MHLCNAFILSRINYAIEIYGDASKKLLKRTQVHQNRILKILQYRNICTSTNAIHRDFGVLKISDQYELKILRLMHLYVNNNEKLPDALQNIFQTRSNIHNYPTRNSDNFQVPKTKNRFGDRAITVKGPRLWNSQPSELNKAAPLKEYVKALKECKLGSYI